jgi:hypothetical protein
LFFGVAIKPLLLLLVLLPPVASLTGWHGCGNVWTQRWEDGFLFRGPVWGEYYRRMKGFDLFLDEIQGHEESEHETYQRYVRRLAERERFAEATV